MDLRAVEKINLSENALQRANHTFLTDPVRVEIFALLRSGPVGLPQNQI
jgi:hypothetical protein